MPTYDAYDETRLAYRALGAGAPLVCLPGGPMQDSVYLGDLGGLSAGRQLILPDLRGTGKSAVPEDVSSYRCDRLVDDVEALREHLGLDRMDLLGHSAGANLAVLYAARHPQRVGRLALITPSVRAVGVTVTPEDRHAAARLRKDEPWFATASAGLEKILAGEATGADWEAVAPFAYGRWDSAAQAAHAAETDQRNDEAAAVFGADGAFDPDTTRAALASLDAPVLLLAGEADVQLGPRPAAEFAALFPAAELVVQPSTGHFPWLEHPDRFLATTAAFLA